MRFKLDENLHRLAGTVLVRAGHDVATVHGQGLAAGPDRLIAETCRREQRCLITLDVEFGNPLLFRPSEHSGIVVVRLPRRGRRPTNSRGRWGCSSVPWPRGR
jgi:predicted nuclease of predicted toxin-antitoxin system